MAPKKKQEKMALGDFLTNQSLGSWADEMETQPIMSSMPSSGGYGRDRDGGERRAFTQPSWETARSGSSFGGGSGMGGSGMGGRGASYDRPRFSDREQLPLPSRPPYTAHLGNLTYDVTSSEIETFFKDCQVTNVRIVEDKLDMKPKGFGYVEFGTLDGLKTALMLTETNFMGRNIKISVAEPSKDRVESNRDFSDWSRKGPLPDLPQNSRQPSRGFNRGGFNNDNMSDAGSERGGSRRPAFFEGDGRQRDYSNWERKGPLSPAPGAGPPMRDGGRIRESGPAGEDRQGPSWGEGRSDAGSRPPRKEFEPRPAVDRVPTAAEMDNQWRAGMKSDPSPVPTPEVSTPSSPQQQAPKERPRLNLTKRTVSTAVESDQAAGAATDSKASPFGAAKPIDTAAKEREIEEKRELALAQKREADEKAKEEKVAKEAAARAARADRADKAQATEDAPAGSPVPEANKGRRLSRQQNGTKQTAKDSTDTLPAAKPSFAILQRDGEEGADGETAAADGEDHKAEANGSTAPAQMLDSNATDAAKGADEVATQEQLSTQEVEEGWAVVEPKTKNNRRGGRGIAA